MIDESWEDSEGFVSINLSLLQSLAALAWSAFGLITLAVIGNANPKNSENTSSRQLSIQGPQQNYSYDQKSNPANSFLINFGQDVKRGFEVTVTSCKNLQPKNKPF